MLDLRHERRVECAGRIVDGIEEDAERREPSRSGRARQVHRQVESDMFVDRSAEHLRQFAFERGAIDLDADLGGVGLPERKNGLLVRGVKTAARRGVATVCWSPHQDTTSPETGTLSW